MNNRQEVKVQTWGPSWGTQHRGDKGLAPEHRSFRRGMPNAVRPARAGLVEVVGA